MINYTRNELGIVTLTIDMPGKVNVINQAFKEALAATVARLYAEREQIVGVILTSAKSTFFAGADLKELLAIGGSQADKAACFAMLQANHQMLRQLETLQRPVVCAMNGSALGGGLEIALACHYRICLDNPKIEISFPEVTLGLLPGAGGVIRTVRMLGLQEAMPYLVEGKKMKPAQALKAGFVQALAQTAEEMLQLAQAWILANPDAAQAWDSAGYKLPGGAVNSAKILPMVQVAPAMLRAKTRGNFPAPEAILATMVEGAQVDFDNALIIEARYFTQLATGQVAKNMMNAFFFQMQEIQAGKSRPKDLPKWRASKVGILGAGMMGAGIAWANANCGIACVLKDVSLAAAEKGRHYSAKLLEKQVKQGRKSEAQAQEVLQLITATASVESLAGCDLIIEAVYENRDLKARVTREVLPMLAAGGLMASNTSTLPITGLAQALEGSQHSAADFIGLHFFSPVDKMKLVEIIKGRQTSSACLAKAFDYVQQIGKIPIVVNDARGFFTSRVFGCFVQEALAMIGEGVPAAMVENAALAVGMPVGALAVQDEVSMTLTLSIAAQAKLDAEAAGQAWQAHPAQWVAERMVQEFQRAGKAAGAGFYEYPQDGKKFLWPGLRAAFEKEGVQLPWQDMLDRILYIQSLETLRCLEENVLESVVDANIGSIFGIGFPAWTGGALQYVNHVGLTTFAARAEELQAKYGERFAIPAILKEKIAAGDVL